MKDALFIIAVLSESLILFWLPVRWASGFSGDHQQNHLLCIRPNKMIYGSYPNTQKLSLKNTFLKLLSAILLPIWLRKRLLYRVQLSFLAENPSWGTDECTGRADGTQSASSTGPGLVGKTTSLVGSALIDPVTIATSHEQQWWQWNMIK